MGLHASQGWVTALVGRIRDALSGDISSVGNKVSQEIVDRQQLETRLTEVIDQKTEALARYKADLVNGKVPASQLPAYVDDVLEFETLAAFPSVGENGKIYIAADTNRQYRWSGRQYVEISASLALGETADTAGRGDQTKAAYNHSRTPGNPHGTTASDVGAYTRAEADAKLVQKQNALSEGQLAAVNSGITTEGVSKLKEIDPTVYVKKGEVDAKGEISDEENVIRANGDVLSKRFEHPGGMWTITGYGERRTLEYNGMLGGNHIWGKDSAIELEYNPLTGVIRALDSLVRYNAQTGLDPTKGDELPSFEYRPDMDLVKFDFTPQGEEGLFKDGVIVQEKDIDDACRLCSINPKQKAGPANKLVSLVGSENSVLRGLFDSRVPYHRAVSDPQNRTVIVYNADELPDRIPLPQIPPLGSNNSVVDLEVWIVATGFPHEGVTFSQPIMTMDGEPLVFDWSATNIVHLTAVAGTDHYIACAAAFK